MTDDIEAEELQSELKYGDWDNYEVEGRDDYLKLIFDAMNSVVFLDDAQIISIHAAKRFSQEKIGIQVNIEEVEA